MESIDEIFQRLLAAREQLKAAREDHSPKPTGREYDAWLTALEDMLQVERELAAAKGEQHAVPLDFPIKWDTGYPAPHLIQNDDKTFLTFIVNEADSDWDGSFVTLKDPADAPVESLALVEFFGCSSAKLGSPNDEVFGGHPLSGKGLDDYSAQQVINSRWVAELQAINSVHHRYNPATWRDRNHYVFWFHDSTFECIAQSFKVELFRESMADLLARIFRRLLE